MLISSECKAQVGDPSVQVQVGFRRMLKHYANLASSHPKIFCAFVRCNYIRFSIMDLLDGKFSPERT